MAANNETAEGTNRSLEPELDGESNDHVSETSQADTVDETDQQASELPLDQVFGILKNKRRRTVLRYLDEHEEPVALGELAEFVAADENDTPVAQITSQERKCAYVGLYQCHLPKMDDMGVVEFNQNRGLIETGTNADQLKRYLDWSETSIRPWPLYYGSTAGAGLVGVLGALLIFGEGVGVAVCLGTVLVIAAIAAVHLHVDRQREE